MKNKSNEIIPRNYYFDKDVRNLRKMFKNKVQPGDILKDINKEVFNEEINMLKEQRKFIENKRFGKQEEFFKQIEILERQRYSVYRGLNKREKELRDKLEKEEILSELRKLENDQIKLVEENKQRELDKLENEKTKLKKKEQDILREVDKLTKKITGRE